MSRHLLLLRSFIPFERHGKSPLCRLCLDSESRITRFTCWLPAGLQCPWLGYSAPGWGGSTPFSQQSMVVHTCSSSSPGSGLEAQGQPRPCAEILCQTPSSKTRSKTRSRSTSSVVKFPFTSQHPPINQRLQSHGFLIPHSFCICGRVFMFFTTGHYRF